MVYHLPCAQGGFGWFYVGDDRSREHAPLEISRFSMLRVLKSCSGAMFMAFDSNKVDFGNLRVLDWKLAWKKRIIDEAVWIEKLNASNKTNCQWKS